MNSEPVDILMDTMGWISTVLVITARPMFPALFRRLLHFLSLSPGRTGYSQVVLTDPMERILLSTYVTELYMSQALVSMPTLVLSSFLFLCYQNPTSFETVDDLDGTVCRDPFLV